MKDYDVLHPMGWDSFGLPAEQHAINTGTHPRDTTKENIANFKRQLQALGFSCVVSPPPPDRARLRVRRGLYGVG